MPSVVQVFSFVKIIFSLVFVRAGFQISLLAFLEIFLIWLSFLQLWMNKYGQGDLSLCWTGQNILFLLVNIQTYFFLMLARP